MAEKKIDPQLMQLFSDVTNIKESVGQIKLSVEHMEEVVLIGNGEPPLREQVHALTRWIENWNKVGWIIATFMIGATITVSCSISFGIIIFLYQANLLKIP